MNSAVFTPRPLFSPAYAYVVRYGERRIFVNFLEVVKPDEQVIFLFAFRQYSDSIMKLADSEAALYTSDLLALIKPFQHAPVGFLFRQFGNDASVQ